MTREEAREECNRWLAYIDQQKEKSVAMQKLAADRRKGLCDDDEAQWRIAQIQGTGIKVYDGARLADAVRVLIADEKHPQNQNSSD